jgi:hypothetical protein
MSPPHEKTGLKNGSRPVHLVVSFALVQLVLHLYSSLSSHDPRLLPPHLVAWLHDLLILSMSHLAFRSVAGWLPLRLRAAGEFLFMALLFVAGLLLSIYPQMLRAYLSFPVNLFAGRFVAASVLLTEYLGLSNLLPLVCAAAAGAVALLLPSSAPVFPGNVRRLLLGFWVLMLVVGLLMVPRSPHPIMNSLREEFTLLMSHAHRDVPYLHPPVASQRESRSTGSGGNGMSAPFRADHIFLIVLEGVTADQFEKEFFFEGAKFFPRIRSQSRYYERYYTTNLDSYTSLIAMLTSEQVPYRAYTDTELYDGVNEAPNLPRSLRRQGFHTLFLSTYEYQPFIPVRRDWTRIMHRRDFPAAKGFVSVESSRMESATEDRAALPTLASFPLLYPKTFALHELAYGHTTEWRAKTGVSQLAYYDAYLNELLDRLIAAGVWSNSLLVIVSDHGDRAKASNPENYRVPLLLAGSGIGQGRDATFRSHLELQRIMSFALTGEPLPPERTDAFVVGSTERWVYGTIRSNGDHLLIDDHAGTAISSHGSLDASDVYRKFQMMIDDFGKHFGR